MRDISVWKKNITRELDEELKNSPIKTRDFLDIELALFLLESIGFNGDIQDGWSVLSGYNFTSNLKENQKRILAKGRIYLQYYKSSFLYRDYLELYLKCPERVRLYEVCRETGLKRICPSVFSKRTDVYQTVLNTCPPHKLVSIKWAEEGKYYFEYKNRIEDIQLPSYRKKNVSDNFLSLKPKKSRKPIKISLKDLIETAKYMDKKLSGNTYEQIIKRISFLNIYDDETITSEKHFTLDGLSHMVGMVGAGKSTLMKVLAVYCYQKDLHITLVLDSISSIFDLLKLMERLEVKVAPLWSENNRENHIKKLATRGHEESLSDIERNGLYKWVSSICPLDGLREDSTVNIPFEAGKQPCSKLKDDKESKQYAYCPYYYDCPSKYGLLKLEEASVYVTTPASFVQSILPSQIYPYRLRLSEFIYKKSDIIVFDEADRVQIDFDSFFAPSKILVDEKGTSWMNELGGRVSSAYYGSGRIQSNDRQASNWHDQCMNAQKILDRIYELLNTNTKVLNWISGRYFSASNLAWKYIYNDRDIDNIDDVYLSLEKFRDDPYEDKGDHLLSKAVKEMFFGVNSVGAKSNILRWGAELSLVIDETDIDKLKLILLVAALERGLKTVVDRWDEGEKAFKLDIDNIPYFTNHLKDYSSIIPEAPMGNIFGFRYKANKNGKLGTLQVIRTMGVGRWILTNFNNMFLDSEEIYGPHTILLSGTSWAPGSSNYNIDIRPTTILKGHDSEMEAIKKSKFNFRHAEFEGKPVFVSGSNGDVRKRNLEKILNYLITPNTTQDAMGKSIIEKEMVELESYGGDRERILLLVGSYDETDMVKGYLDNHLARVRGWKKHHIVKLESDDKETIDEGSIHRGAVSEFAKSDGKILVAPLLAIERGHNILNENNVGAIGSVFFLVRPMPVPYDLDRTIYYVNRWGMEKIRDLSSIGSIKEFRKLARRTFEANLVQGEKNPGFRHMQPHDRNSLSWTQLVAIWQVIGRLVRGGSEARVHFCDGKFAPNSVKGEKDSQETSLLVSMQQALGEYFRDDNKDIKPVEREIAKQLYEPLYYGLSNIKGVEYNEK